MNLLPPISARGYPLSCFEDALCRLRKAGLEVVVHTILGLPGKTGKICWQLWIILSACDIQGIKLQLLHVLKGTDLAYDYLAGKFKVLERDQYIDLVIDCLEHLDPSIVIHRVDRGRPKRSAHCTFMGKPQKRSPQSSSPPIEGKTEFSGKSQ